MLVLFYRQFKVQLVLLNDFYFSNHINFRKADYLIGNVHTTSQNITLSKNIDIDRRMEIGR